MFISNKISNLHNITISAIREDPSWISAITISTLARHSTNRLLIDDATSGNTKMRSNIKFRVIVTATSYQAKDYSNNSSRR